ncbi:MAG TPA: hypothetical protein VF559_08875 [Caulobacteraceae bacterium]|jgi:hypothetical protein
MTLHDPAAPPPATREAVLISGMHRSGTAAASRAMSFLGYSQPQLLAEAGPENPRGFWQPTRIVELNEAMIETLGWSWDHIPLLTQPAATVEEAEAGILAHLSAEWLQQARAAIRESWRPDAQRIVCKDPRISLFPAFWQAAFEAEGFRVQHVVAFRQPLAVAASLKATRGLGRWPALRAWLAYNLRPLAQVTVDAALDFDDLIHAPRRAMDQLAVALGRTPLDDVAASELLEFIDRSHHDQPAPEEDEGERLVPALVEDTFELLRGWRRGPRRRLERRAQGLRARLNDAQMLFGRVRRLPPLSTAPAVYTVAPAQPAARRDGEPRAVVLHYHLFKNAGTSVDEVLQANFGEGWGKAEFSAGRSNVAEVEAWLAAHPTVRAMSSHTALLPPPRLAGVAAAPVIFVRHPIDRIHSAYEFERRQGADTRGSRLAKSTDFAGYLRKRLAGRERQCRNFQTGRLARGVGGGEPELQRALRALDELPFVGLVEDFTQSMTRMEIYLRGYFPEFRAFGAKANVLRGGATLSERLRRVRAELGEAMWEQLLTANADDLLLWEEVAARYSHSGDALIAA